MKFKKITIKCSSEIADTIAYFLHETGSMGEVFDDYGDVKQVLDEKRWDYADAQLFVPTYGCTVDGYFSIETDETTVIDNILAMCSEIECDSKPTASVAVIDSEEWENEWKKYYKPTKIGKVVIVPEWLTYHATGAEIIVKLNPGLAFGTGMHETTSMCIELMQRISLKGKRVLDFGCGSGILGICALALGADEVVFADTDEQAITATKYNCTLNGIDNPTILCCDVRNMKNPADIVVANITADVLIDVRDIIKNALKSGGYTIISGIISDKKQKVSDEYQIDFKPIHSEQKNEWSAFLFKL